MMRTQITDPKNLTRPSRRNMDKTMSPTTETA